MSTTVEQLKKAAQTAQFVYPFFPVFPDLSEFKLKSDSEPPAEAQRLMDEFYEAKENFVKEKQKVEGKVVQTFANEYGLKFDTVSQLFEYAKTNLEYEELYGYILELEEVLKVFKVALENEK